jgi:4,5-dihydroxyphthalate decarboxylase
MTQRAVPLTYGGGLYDRTAALFDGRVQPEGIDLNFVPLRPSEVFWRMLKFQEFEVSELSCANYFVLRSRSETPYIAIPVFPSRSFRHSAIYVNPASGIREPADLKGKRVGCAEYAMTMAVWVRALLQHEYGVSPSDFTWVTGGLEEPGRGDRIPTTVPAGVRVEAAPSGQALVPMLERRYLDALFSPGTPSTFRSGSPNIARLFPDFPRVEGEYYRKTRHFPIMHTVVMRRDVYERMPWAAVSLYKAFLQARDLALDALLEADALAISLAWSVNYMEQERALRGADDLWAYGFEPNRHTLEALKGYLAEQGLLENDFAIEDAFAPSTLSLSRL